MVRREFSLPPVRRRSPIGSPGRGGGAAANSTARSAGRAGGVAGALVGPGLELAGVEFRRRRPRCDRDRRRRRGGEEGCGVAFVLQSDSVDDNAEQRRPERQRGVEARAPRRQREPTQMQILGAAPLRFAARSRQHAKSWRIRASASGNFSLPCNSNPERRFRRVGGDGRRRSAEHSRGFKARCGGIGVYVRPAIQRQPDR